MSLGTHVQLVCMYIRTCVYTCIYTYIYIYISSCLRQVPPPCQPSPLGGGCSNDSDYDDVDDNVARDNDDDDDDDDDDDHEEGEEAELALGQRWDWLQLVDFVLNVAQVDRGLGGRYGRL